MYNYQAPRVACSVNYAPQKASLEILRNIRKDTV